MEAAERSGLPKQNSSRIAGRVSPSLVQEAKRRTDTDLIAFALANEWRYPTRAVTALPDALWRFFSELGHGDIIPSAAVQG